MSLNCLKLMALSIPLQTETLLLVLYVIARCLADDHKASEYSPPFILPLLAVHVARKAHVGHGVISLSQAVLLGHFMQPWNAGCIRSGPWTAHAWLPCNIIMVSRLCHAQEKHGTSFEDFFELLQEAAEEQGLTEGETEGCKDWVPLQCVEDFISNFNDGAQHFMAATFPEHYLKNAHEPVSADTPADSVSVGLQNSKAFISLQGA